MSATVIVAGTMLAVPSNDVPPMFLAVANAVAVAAFPVVEPEEPVMLPSMLATRVPVVTVRLPVLVPVAVVVPT